MQKEASDHVFGTTQEVPVIINVLRYTTIISVEAEVNSMSFAETEIRPEELKGGQQQAVSEDIDRLLSKSDKFIEVKCPSCGSENRHFKFEKNKFSYYECDQCSTFYITPRPDEEILEWFYKDSSNYRYWNKYIFPASEQARREKIFIPRVEKTLAFCEKYSVELNSVLEIGAGFGTFCEELSSRNVFDKIVALELTPELAQTCRNRGLEVLEIPVEKMNRHTRFDVIVSFEVIEHLFSPINFANSVRRLLNPGGILVLSCPNGKGFDIEVLGTLSDSVDHEHLNYFNPDSLTGMLERCGFSILETLTPGVLDADIVRNKILNDQFSIKNNPFFKTIFFDEWDRLRGPFQNFLTENGLSSNLWVVAQAPK